MKIFDGALAPADCGGRAPFIIFMTVVYDGYRCD